MYESPHTDMRDVLKHAGNMTAAMNRVSICGPLAMLVASGAILPASTGLEIRMELIAAR